MSRFHWRLFADDYSTCPSSFGCAAPTLAETVGVFLRTDGEHLNAFSFKTVPDETARQVLADELSLRTRSDLEQRIARVDDPAATTVASSGALLLIEDLAAGAPRRRMRRRIAEAVEGLHTS